MVLNALGRSFSPQADGGRHRNRSWAVCRQVRKFHPLPEGSHARCVGNRIEGERYRHQGAVRAWPMNGNR